MSGIPTLARVPTYIVAARSICAVLRRGSIRRYSISSGEAMTSSSGGLLETQQHSFPWASSYPPSPTMLEYTGNYAISSRRSLH